MDLFRSKKRDVEQASLEDGPGLKRKHHGLSSSLDNLLDIGKENADYCGTLSDNTASESDDELDTNKASKKQKAFAKISIKREKKKEKELRKKTEKNMISMEDFLGKQTEFKMWLYEEKCKNAGEISSPKLKVFFKQFVRLWNKKKLAHKYYRCSTLPESPAPLTPKKCNFLTGTDNCQPLPVDTDNPVVAVNPPTSPFVTFGKTPPKVFKSKKFQLFGSSKDIALLSVAPIGSPQVIHKPKQSTQNSQDQYQVPKIGRKEVNQNESPTDLSEGPVPYKVSVYPWATDEENTNDNRQLDICTTETPPGLTHQIRDSDEAWPPPPTESEIHAGNMTSIKDSPHIPPPPPPRIASLKKRNTGENILKSPKLASNYSDPYDRLPDSSPVKCETVSHYLDPVDCVSTTGRTNPDNPRLVLQTLSQCDEPDLSLYCKPVSEKRLSKEELEELYAKPLKRAKKNDIGSIDGMSKQHDGNETKDRDVQKEPASELFNEIMDHINKKTEANVDTKSTRINDDPDYATIDECMTHVLKDKQDTKVMPDSADGRQKDEVINIGNIPLIQPRISSPKFATISRSKKMRVMAASTEKIYETYLSMGRKGNPFKSKRDHTDMDTKPAPLTHSLKLKSKSQPDISFSEGLQPVEIETETVNHCKNDFNPSFSTFKPVENDSRSPQTWLKNSDRAKSFEDGLRCVAEPKTPTIVATPSFDSLCNVTPLSCKSRSSQSLPAHSGSFESLSNQSSMSISTSSSLSFGPDEKSRSLQSLHSDKSLSPVKEEEEQTLEKLNQKLMNNDKRGHNSDETEKDIGKTCDSRDVYVKNSVVMTPGKISALKHGIDLSVYLLKPQKDKRKVHKNDLDPENETSTKNESSCTGTNENCVNNKQTNTRTLEGQSRLVIKDSLSGVKTKLEPNKAQRKEVGRRHTVQTVNVTDNDEKKDYIPNVSKTSKTRQCDVKSSRSVSVSCDGNTGPVKREVKKRDLNEDNYLETDLDSVTSDRPRRPMKKSKSHSGLVSSTVTTDIW
ncbi:hypothetical protein ACF0H5_007560 [Mactra antiquata]